MNCFYKFFHVIYVFDSKLPWCSSSVCNLLIVLYKKVMLGVHLVVSLDLLVLFLVFVEVLHFGLFHNLMYTSKIVIAEDLPIFAFQDCYC